MCRYPQSLPTLMGVPGEEIDCIRGCLIREDQRARSNPNYFTNSCPKCLKDDVLNGYHIACFSLCGVETWRYPGLFGILGNE